MKLSKIITFFLVLCFVEAYSELVNINPDPNGEPWYDGGLVLNEEGEAFLNSLPRMSIPNNDIGIDLPESYDISESQHFREIFNQSDGCCAQASMIGYTFTYKVNKINGTTASAQLANQFPTHFTYNFVNRNSGGRSSTFGQAIKIASESGIPNSEVWNELTGDPLAGDIGFWMSGYDRYKEALNNRSILTEHPTGGYVIDVNCDDNKSEKETLANVKYYLSEQLITHQNVSVDGPLSIGMLMTMGSYEMDYILGDGFPVIKTHPIMISTGTDFYNTSHAMTVVGYDDNIRYDFNKDGRINNSTDINNDGEVTMAEWEVGALKVVNSWGAHWPDFDDGGYFYLPYRFINKLTRYNFVGMAVEKKSTPEMTYKVNMQHHNRYSLGHEIGLSDDPSSDIFTGKNLEVKDLYTFSQHSGYIPMRGDGDYRPIEFCFQVPQSDFAPKKYFYIVGDRISNDLDLDVVPSGFTPKILNFELIDERYKKFIIPCNESDVNIVDFDTTVLSIIYDVYLENEITSDFTFEYNVGIIDNVDIVPNKTLTLADNTKLYFHNSGLSSSASNILIEGNANFVGFSSTTSDIISVENAQIIVGKSLRLKNCDLILDDFTTLILTENAELVVSEGSDLIISPNANIQFGTGSKITLEKGGKLTLLDNSILTVNNQSMIEIINSESGINYGFNTELKIYDNSSLILGENTLYEATTGSVISIAEGSTLRLYEGAEFAIKSGSEINFESNTTMIEAETGAKITLKSGVTLNLDGVVFNGTGYDGIVAEDESIVLIQNCNFNGAKTAVSGAPDICNVSNSTFVDCIDGVNLNGTHYNLSSNHFIGKDLMGTAITVVQSSGKIIDNQIKGFFRGVINVSCSPKMYGNTIKNNARNGLYSSGLNSVPVLTDMTIIDIKSTEPSNTIINNGDGYIGHPVPIVHMPSQISVVNGSNIYMKYCNNYIYPSPGSDVFCMLGAKILQQGPINFPTVEHYVDARGNYWGTNDVTSDMFYTDPYYSIDFSDEVKIEDGIPITSPLPDSESKSFDLLMKAFEAEVDGKYDKSIHFYEKIIKKYPESDEAMVAYTNLPDSYNEEGLDLEPLISIYDTQLASDDDKVNKKFFKEMKVATKIKGKKYDEAIALSEEMILEAESEEEEILCEIDIAIANMMKGSSKGSSKTDHTKTLNDLLAKLNEGEEEGEVKTDIAGSALPTEFTLYQNYPNPFNPVTQIKFALPTASDVKLNVYNINGQLVSELVKGSKEAGIHKVNYDASNFNSGMYFYTLEANGMSITKKMILTK
ncbi:MAG: T9SS type A sorting domain-containing protein [Candidatus Delongbacteria bacterium]|nr:T9SS type A sorting domain-containing protein [Candidatus Delongbacteria bacterium]